MERSLKEQQSSRKTQGSTPKNGSASFLNLQHVISDDFSELLREAKLRVTTKIASSQGGVPTFFDNLLLSMLQFYDILPKAGGHSVNDSGFENDLAIIRDVIREYMGRCEGQRFMEFRIRVSETRGRGRYPWELQNAQMAISQGVYDCLQWRGMPLFKTAFDFALYPMMLWDIRPGSILELGSGGGASACWFSDLMALFGVSGRVVSVDLVKPQIEKAGVQFIQGDCNEIETVFPINLLETLQHPWMVIEDAHVNTEGVLRYLREFLEPGDYVIVEDSETKMAALSAFANEAGTEFMVDTKYTDFFGRNSTCSKDSIFVKAR